MLVLKWIRLAIENVIELHAFLGLNIDELCVALDAFEFFMLLDFGMSRRSIYVFHIPLI